jgi:hypothetical protein
LQTIDVLDVILAETYSNNILESFKSERGDGSNTGMRAYNLVGFGVFVIEKI